MKNLVKAMLNVSLSIKGIEKSMNVGSGNFSYKGVSDYEVKKLVRKSMFDNGLVIIPTKVVPTTTIERWEEVDQYSKTTPKAMKQKQQVFTEIVTTYTLLHDSGESIELQGYGHGVDAQDKAAGKATTYALKYALLYAFLIPTGDIDDSDQVHSNDHPIPAKKEMAPPKKVLPFLKPTDKKWNDALEKETPLATVLQYFQITELNKTEYTKQLNAKL